MRPILIPFIGMLQNWTCIIAHLSCKVKETALQPCAESHIQQVLAIAAVCGKEGLIGIHKYLVYHLNHMVSSSCNRQKLFFSMTKWWLFSGTGLLLWECNRWPSALPRKKRKLKTFLCWLRDSANSTFLSFLSRGHWWRLDIYKRFLCSQDFFSFQQMKLSWNFIWLRHGHLISFLFCIYSE